MSGQITFAELVALYGERLALAYLRVIERHAAEASAGGRTAHAGASIIPFDRNLRLQRALDALAA